MFARFCADTQAQKNAGLTTLLVAVRTAGATYGDPGRKRKHVNTQGGFTSEADMEGLSEADLMGLWEESGEQLEIGRGRPQARRVHFLLRGQHGAGTSGGRTSTVDESHSIAQGRATS